MTRDEAKLIVQETLVTMGLDVSEPVELQKDMAYLRSLRTGSDQIKKHGILLFLGALVTAIVGWVALGFKVSLN